MDAHLQDREARYENAGWQKYFVSKIVGKEEITDFDLGPFNNPLANKSELEGMIMKFITAKVQKQIKARMRCVAKEQGHGHVSRISYDDAEYDRGLECWIFEASAWMR